jgi:hypothetical protein
LSLRNKLKFIHRSLDIVLKSLFVEFGSSKNIAKIFLCSLINKDAASLQACKKLSVEIVRSVAVDE